MPEPAEGALPTANETTDAKNSLTSPLPPAPENKTVKPGMLIGKRASEQTALSEVRSQLAQEGNQGQEKIVDEQTQEIAKMFDAIDETLPEITVKPFETAKEFTPVAHNDEIDYVDYPLFGHSEGEPSQDVSTYNKLVRTLKNTPDGRMPPGTNIRFIITEDGQPQIELYRKLTDTLSFVHILDPMFHRGTRWATHRTGKLHAKNLFILNTTSNQAFDLTDLDPSVNVEFNTPSVHRTLNKGDSIDEENAHLRQFGANHAFTELSYGDITKLEDIMGVAHEFGHFIEERHNPLTTEASAAIAAIQDAQNTRIHVDDTTYTIGRKALLDMEMRSSLYALALAKRLKEEGIDISPTENDDDISLAPLIINRRFSTYGRRYRPRNPNDKTYYPNPQEMQAYLTAA